MTFCPGSVGRVRLAGEDDLERALGVPQHPGQPVDVGEQQPGPLVGREPAGEADRQDRRVERGIELGQHGRRLAVAGELAAQPALGEMRELALLAQVRVPQVARRDALDALPEAALLRGRVEVVEVGVEVALEQVRDRGADPGRSVDAVGDAQDLVVRDPGPRPVGGLGVELAHGVGAVGQAQREGRHVELRAVAVRADARARGPCRSARRPPSSSGPATRRTRSASNRSFPAETGVWIVKTLFARTVVQARSSAVPPADAARGPARRAGTRSGPR